MLDSNTFKKVHIGKNMTTLNLDKLIKNNRLNHNWLINAFCDFFADFIQL